MTKSVTIQIAAGDLETLKNNSYQLCFAKEVNGVFNVIWQSYDDYLNNNVFSWTPTYQLFGTNSFEGGVAIEVTTNVVNISLGDQATIDKAGEIGPASSSQFPNSILFNNDYGAIHPGLNSLSTGLDGTQSSTPIYVAQDQIVIGQDQLTPVDVVQVWFDQNVETSTMISDAIANATTIDLTSVDTATQLYSNGVWSTPGSLKRTAVKDSLGGFLKILITGVTTAAAAAVVLKIATKLTGVYQDFSVSWAPTQNGFALSYSEKTKLSASAQRFLRTLSTDPATIDQLVIFALEACSAEMKTQFQQFAVSYGGK